MPPRGWGLYMFHVPFLVLQSLSCRLEPQPVRASRAASIKRDIYYIRPPITKIGMLHAGEVP